MQLVIKYISAGLVAICLQYVKIHLRFPPSIPFVPSADCCQREKSPDSRVLVSVGSDLPSCQSGPSHLTAFKDCPAEIEGNGNFYMMQSGDPRDLKSELVPRFTQESKQRQKNREPGLKGKKMKRKERRGGLGDGNISGGSLGRSERKAPEWAKARLLRLRGS